MGEEEFLDLLIERLNSPSLRGLLQFGFDVNYSTLKNYYNESRLISEDLFEELLEISGLDKAELSFGYPEGNWGRVKGGRIGRK